MTHRSLVRTCESLELKVGQGRSDGTRHHWEATGNGARVYWDRSFDGGILGLPRVVTAGGRDTHARSGAKINYLISFARTP